MSIIKTLVQLSMLSKQATKLLPETEGKDSKRIRFIRLFVAGLFTLAVLLIVSHYTRWIKSNGKNWIWICFFAVVFLVAFTMRKIDKESETEEEEEDSGSDDQR